ncbi:MAG: glycosyltransferase family 4 protein [Muribaculaceae bacterium]|nr:glycosyltransferase family 4 protein [Muribaculaceae bacterium]
MKVLIVHNNYGKYSGEEAVVDKMAAMLTGLGHTVVQYRVNTAKENLAGKVKGFISGFYNPKGVQRMREIIRKEKPDIINIHNLYPFITPASLRECKIAGVPVIMTVHNFRLLCPTGLFMRKGKPCESCLNKGNEWGCVIHNCEQSIPKSIGYALRNAVARIGHYYKDNVDYLACITNFQREKLIEGGFDKERIIVIPNAVEATEESEPSMGDYVAYCGRLSREKGIDLIIDVAKKHPEISFKLAGECREKELVADIPSNVELLGYISGNKLNEFYRNARFLVMASRCYEGFPMSILEGARYYKPTIGPDHGGFSEIIGKGDSAIGKVFSPGDADALEAAIVSLWNNTMECRRLGTFAQGKLFSKYSTSVISKKWDTLLNSIVQRSSIKRQSVKQTPKVI